MQRVEGYAPEYGDWYWVKYDASGGVDENEEGVGLAGQVAGCIACHMAADGDDMVFVNGGTEG